MFGSQQQEQDVALSIKKALTTDELAPKQKHVRSLILYSWQVKSPGSLFIALKTFPIISDQIVIYKALILFHKLIRQGHPQVLKEALNELGWSVVL
jgi:huntingtin-interacting protein 1-related protein